MAYLTDSKNYTSSGTATSPAVKPPPVTPSSPAPVSGTGFIGSYKGVPITAGTDAQVQAQVNAINASQSAAPTPTPSTTQSGSGTTPTTQTSNPTPSSTNDSVDTSNQALLDQSQIDYQRESENVQNTIKGIQNDSIPLSAGEQAQVAGLQQQFSALIQQQQVINESSKGIANIRGYQTGAAEYDPTFQVKTIGAIISAGQMKIAEFVTAQASAVAKLTQGLKDAKIANVKDAFELYQTASEKRQKALQDTIDEAAAAIKAARDEYYNRVEKPRQDIAVEAAKNGATPSQIAKINAAGSVQDAISAAGDTLQTATGDAGAYLFEKRQAERNGTVPPDYNTWKAALEQQKLNTELTKLRATEGIKFNYAIALEKAKNTIANEPNPDYNGDFAATIKLAAQAGGTNAQRSQIKADLEDFISGGDYGSAYAQIISSAGAKLTGTNRNSFQDQVASYEALKEMRTALKGFQAAGGDTNIFKGGADAIQTKLGVLATSPEYAAIATRLNSAFQQYRQNMTGAAFGAKESAEYASVLPSAGNTFSLNMAKIDGAQAYLNGVVESTLKTTVGDGGIYIKQYAEASTNVQQKQQNAQAAMTAFRAADPKNEQMIQEIHAAFPDLSLDQIAEQLGL